MFVYLVQVHPSQFAEYGRTRRHLARAELFFAPFSFNNYRDISRVCTCHTLQTGTLGLVLVLLMSLVVYM